MTAITKTQPTMTSVELVAVINSMREEGKAELLHKNFMVRLEGHPGIDSAKFLAQYKDSTGRMLKCYHLPKREAELMVLSESLAVQAKVYDRMVELEGLVTSQKSGSALGQPAKEFRAAMSLAKLIGLNGNQAVLSANQAVRRITGVDVLQSLGATHLIASVQAAHFTASELGARIGLSAQKFNAALALAGMQVDGRDGKGKVTHVPTDAGRKHSVLLDTGKAQGGAPVTQLKWFESVLPIVEAARDAIAAQPQGN